MTETTQDELLHQDELAALRKISSPTIANAIETFGVRPRAEGITGAGVCCLFPEFGAVVGYACTATILSRACGGEAPCVGPTHRDM